MLYVDYEHYDPNAVVQPIHTMEWHVGEEVALIRGISRRVVTLAADGDEKEYILKNFNGLVYNVNKRILTLHGDIAACVAANL